MKTQAGAEQNQQRSGFWKIAPWLSRAVMILPSIVLVLVGLRIFRDPEHAIPGVAFNTPEAFTDMRSSGAWLLAAVAMMAVFLASNRRLWLGHLHMAALMGFTLGVRLFGFAHDGTTLAMGNELQITIAETIFLVVNLAGFAVQAFARRAEATELREAI